MEHDRILHGIVRELDGHPRHLVDDQQVAVFEDYLERDILRHDRSTCSWLESKHNQSSVLSKMLHRSPDGHGAASARSSRQHPRTGRCGGEGD